MILFFLLLFSCSSTKKNEEAGSNAVVKSENGVITSKNKTYSQEERELYLKCTGADSQKVISALLTDISQNKDLGRNLFTLGNCFFYNGNYKKALFNYGRTLAQNPPDEMKKKVYNNLGVVHYKNGKYDRALQSFRKSAELGQDRVSALNLAFIEAVLNLTEKLKDRLNFLMQQNESDPLYQSMLAFYSLKTNSFQISVEYFEKLPSEFFDNEIILINYWIALLKASKFDTLKKSLSNKINDVKELPYYKEAVLEFPDLKNDE